MPRKGRVAEPPLDVVLGTPILKDGAQLGGIDEVTDVWRLAAR